MAAAPKIRLDRLVVERGLAETGAKAQALIWAGRIRAPGVAALKPGEKVSPDQPLELIEGLKYVSRGGEKLAGALAHFRLDVRGRACADLGASTGGFTDCLLQAGASRVLAIDVGTAQLHEKLRRDPRVVSREGVHVLSLTRDDLAVFPIDRVVVDLSFISLAKVLPHLAGLVGPGVEFLVLVKPQFEAGPRGAPKGVVKDPAVRDAVLTRISARVAEWGFVKRGQVDSVLKGPKGNQETFFYLVKK